MSAASRTLDTWIAGKLGLGPAPLTRAALEDWQLRRLRQTLGDARTASPFYRRHADALDPKRLASLADVASLPFTTAEDIREDPLRFVCVPQGEISRIVTLDSSGTTGHPKRLFFTGPDQEITIDFFQHGVSLMAGPGDRVMILLPGDRPGGVGDLLVTAVRRLGGEPIPFGIVRDAPEAAGVLARKAPDLVIGIPVQVLALARAWRTAGLDRGAPRCVLLCTDNVSQAIVDELFSIWKSEVFRDWGMTEMGYGGGVDCSLHRGYHLQENDFLFEIVDPETGRPVPDGTPGEVVFTTLTRSGMPLIRYRTGDLSRFVEGPCPCGSVLRRLEGIRTRKTGRLVLARGEITMSALDEALFRIPGLADFDAALIQNRDPPTLLVRISAAPSRRSDARDMVATVTEALGSLPDLRANKESGDLSIEVKMADGTIPVSSGKRTIRRDGTP